MMTSTAAQSTYNKMDPQDSERAVHDLVRYALFSVGKRQLVKRDDMTRQGNRVVYASYRIVLQPAYSRAFPVVLDKAQQALRQVFGLELVQVDKARSNPLKRPQGPPSKDTTKLYVVKSILPAELCQSGVVQHDVQDRALVGLCMVVLSLVHVHGGALQDGDVKHYLNRLDTSYPEGYDQALGTLVQQGYLDKVVLSTGATHQGDMVYEYRWGGRAKAEVSTDDVAQFICTFYGQEDREQLLVNIHKAAQLNTTEQKEDFT
jgi:hypothetical protein